MVRPHWAAEPRAARSNAKGIRAVGWELGAPDKTPRLSRKNTLCRPLPMVRVRNSIGEGWLTQGRYRRRYVGSVRTDTCEPMKTKGLSGVYTAGWDPVICQYRTV